MDDHIQELADVISDISIGSAAIVQKKINNKELSFIIIRDSMKRMFLSYYDIKLECKCALISCLNVISSHIVIRVSGSDYDDYYPIYFNYFNEECLKIILTLMKQKKIYIILCDENDECIEMVYHNEMKKFFKKYINRVISSGCQWTSEQYESSIQEISRHYRDTEEFWDCLGGSIELDEVKN